MYVVSGVARYCVTDHAAVKAARITDIAMKNR
jgi:hypothetical protein